MLENAEFYEESLNVASCPISERRRFRKAWFAGALEKLAECDIVFADPDNGIVDDDDRRKGSAKFGKQIPIDEIRRLAEGRCAIIYHHNTRRPGGHDAEVNHLLSEIALPSFAIRAKAHSPRTFFVINADEEIAERCKIFCERWGKMKVSLYHQL
ncbi:hypothetical protein ATO1_13675 [Phaeobacter sp. 22II1-1F12B]|nr:hypothetical protein ATO1_13675 [Phaeobacter sp. 22II1-1F12B]